MTLGCNNFEIRKSEFVAKTQIRCIVISNKTNLNTFPDFVAAIICYQNIKIKHIDFKTKIAFLKMFQ